MRNKKRSDADWNTPTDTGFTWQHVEVELLMDIRDELKRLNELLNCHNFIRIPTVLDSIYRNTRKPVKRKKKATK